MLQSPCPDRALAHGHHFFQGFSQLGIRALRRRGDRGELEAAPRAERGGEGPGQEPQQAEYVDDMLRDTFENWQSEFLQLLWQVCGLAYFLYVGSPSSKENDDRVEAKIDALLIMQGKAGFDIMEKLDRHYLREAGHAEPTGHNELDDILSTLHEDGVHPETRK